MSASFALLFARAGARGRGALRPRDLASAIAAAGVTIVLFHFVAIDRAPLLFSVLPAAALSVFAGRRYREDAWEA